MVAEKCACPLELQGCAKPVTLIPNTKANEWSPAIAADARGNVFVAWDTCDEGNYDVRLQVIGKQPKTLTVAESARGTRLSLVFDIAVSSYRQALFQLL